MMMQKTANGFPKYASPSEAAGSALYRPPLLSHLNPSLLAPGLIPPVCPVNIVPGTPQYQQYVASLQHYYANQIYNPAIVQQQEAERQAQNELQLTYNIAYTLAACLVEDNVPEEEKETYQFIRAGFESWAVEVGTFDTKIRTMMATLGAKVYPLSHEQIPLSKCSPNETIILHGWEDTQVDTIDDESLKHIVNFVANGGQLVAINSAIRFVERAFPGKIQSGEKQNCEKTNAKVQVLSKEDATKIYHRTTLECSLEPRCRGIRVIDKTNVQVVAQIQARYLGDRPVIVRFPFQQGTVVVLSCLLTERERTSSTPMETIKQYLKNNNASEATTRAWLCAGKCSYDTAYPIATSIFPFMYFLAKIVLSQKLKFRDRPAFPVPDPALMMAYLAAQGAPMPMGYPGMAPPMGLGGPVPGLPQPIPPPAFNGEPVPGLPSVIPPQQQQPPQQVKQESSDTGLDPMDSDYDAHKFIEDQKGFLANLPTKIEPEAENSNTTDNKENNSSNGDGVKTENYCDT